MKSNAQLQSDVEAELEWDPSIAADGIKVAVKNGTVTLSGLVPSYPDKTGAETAVKRVSGVQAVINDLRVNLPEANIEPDNKIAQDALAILVMQFPRWANRIKVTVTGHRLTLDGDVEWHFQKDAIESVAARTRGIVDLINRIVIEPQATAIQVREKIELALRRGAMLEPGAVIISTKGSTVTLDGKTRSWNERNEVERTAWSAPGVLSVDNRIAVSGEASPER